MNTDLLPLSVLALESSAPGRLRDGQTLTLGLDFAPVHPAREAMSGSVSVGEITHGDAPELRAAVLPANAAALTITF